MALPSPALDPAALALFAGLSTEPRPYQLRICSAAVEHFLGEHRDRSGEVEPAAHSVLIESPTGSGKTVMGLAIARAMQRRAGYRVGWASMRRNLLAQAAEENARRGFGVELSLISMFDKSPPPVDMLIVDEAQHDAAMSMANLHSMLHPKKILGLSATPFRTDRVNLCFDRTLRDAGLQQLVSEGYLSAHAHYTIARYAPDTVAECYLREPGRWGKSLVFFHREDECEAFRRLLALAGVRAEVVTARSDRERQLEAFERGEVAVLVNMAILTEGFDCPSLKTVFCRPSGRGCTIQMAGRVFRKSPETPVKQVVQCEQTRHPMLRTALPAEQYVWTCGEWRSLTINRRLSAISHDMLRLVAGSKSDLPVYVTRRRAPLARPLRPVVEGRTDTL